MRGGLTDLDNPADEKQWDRKIVVTCDSVAQKQALAERAKATGLSLSKYALNKTLAREPEIAEVRALLKKAEHEQNRVQEELAVAKAVMERQRVEAQRHVRNLENCITVLIAERSRLSAAIGEPDEGRFLGVLDAQVVNLIAASKADGKPLSVQDREIVLKLDKLEDPMFTSTLIDWLDRLASIGMTERVFTHGRTASRWRGEL